MTKKGKLIAVTSVAALMTIGASSMAFAATAHWEQEGEDWVYLDSDRDMVTDTWKKSGSNWYYLDSDGYMARDQIIVSGSDDDIYYVDSTGAKVINTWVSMDNEGDYECTDQEDISTIWYYFGSDGKAKRGDGTSKVYTNIPYGTNGSLTGTFAFDEDGHMLSGWQDIELSSGSTYTYYFNGENEGWAAMGWQYLERPDDEDYEDEPDDDEAWYYFGTNGRAVKDQTKYINGYYYTFDETGAMDDTWVTGTPGVSNSTASIATNAAAFYTEDVGYRRSGWIYTYDPDDEDEEGDEYWYYLSTKGEAFNDEAKDAISNEATGVTATDLYEGDVYEDVAAKVIKNKTYLFDGNGRMITGVVKLEGGNAYRSGGSDLADGAIYYFSDEDGSYEGAMETGKTTYDDEGEDVVYYFKDNGQAYTNTLVSGAIYDAEGKRVEAEDGATYMLYVTEDDIMDEDGKTVEIAAGTQVVVNRSGTVKKSGTVEVDGVDYTIDRDTYEATEDYDD